jgi:hypothetical protein
MLQILGLQHGLILKQKIVHFPETALRACGFCRFGGLLGMRMNAR